MRTRHRKPDDRPIYGPVSSYPVAEHRYKFNEPLPKKLPVTYSEVKAAAPYKPGDVVYVIHGKGFRKAIVYSVECKRDIGGDWRECYRVFPETQSGNWSKLFYVAYPGYIQRGYQRAGLAPDIPD